MKRDVYKEIRDIDLCIDFEVLKVKVPFRFLGTVGFSLRRDVRYFDFKHLKIYAHLNISYIFL
jgi:hypothetical protein